jgi:hypothetical protein
MLNEFQEMLMQQFKLLREEMKEDLSDLKGDMKSDMRELKSDMRETREDGQETKLTLARVDERLKTLEEESTGSTKIPNPYAMASNQPPPPSVRLSVLHHPATAVGGGGIGALLISWILKLLSGH